MNTNCPALSPLCQLAWRCCRTERPRPPPTQRPSRLICRGLKESMARSKRARCVRTGRGDRGRRQASDRSSPIRFWASVSATTLLDDGRARAIVRPRAAELSTAFPDRQSRFPGSQIPSRRYWRIKCRRRSRRWRHPAAPRLLRPKVGGRGHAPRPEGGGHIGHDGQDSGGPVLSTVAHVVVNGGDGAGLRFAPFAFFFASRYESDRGRLRIVNELVDSVRAQMPLALARSCCFEERLRLEPGAAEADLSFQAVTVGKATGPHGAVDGDRVWHSESGEGVGQVFHLDEMLRRLGMCPMYAIFRTTSWRSPSI